MDGSFYLTRYNSIHHLQLEAIPQRMRDIFGWIAEGTLHLQIGQTFPLAETGNALAALENRQNIGKLLIIP